MKVELQKNLDEIIKDTITPILKAKKFKKNARNYYCPREHYGICLNIQSSIYNSSEEIRFTFNIGIFIPPSYVLFYGQPALIFPKECDCLVRKRIGDLIAGKDKWYSITKYSDMEIIRKEIQSDLHNYAVPFIEDQGTISDVVEREIFKLRKNPNCGYGAYRLQVAAAAIKMGYIEDGVKIIKHIYATSENDAFNDRARDIAGKLGVEI